MARISRILVVGLIVMLAPRAAAPQSAVSLTREQMEAFLATAEIIRERTTSDGVTRPIRATLSNGVLTHDAQFQTVDEAKALFSAGKASEIDFKDTYRYNIAGYRLALLVGLDTVPMSVERRYKGKSAAVTWWIDDVMFDESGRIKLGDAAMMGPDPQRTQRQIHIMRVWDELIQNRDRNRGNVLWTKDWTLWLIDHTRAFRLNTNLLKPEQLSRCDRGLLERLRAVTPEALAQAVGNSLTKQEQEALLARRDKIIKHYDERIARLGEPVVLFTL